MQGITARVRYAKSGLARFIGHLDTARALLRTVRRAGIEALYTQGFSPRLCLSFGPPLPLGLTSDCEYMDIKLARRCDPETLKERLQSHFAEGLAVMEVEVMGEQPSALQTAFWATEYEVSLPGQGLGVTGQGPLPGWSEFVKSPRSWGLADTPPESPPAREHPEVASDGGVPGKAGRESAIVDLFWREGEGGEQVLSVTLRHDVPGGGRVKDVVRRVLGTDEAGLNRLRIHKKRVCWRGEKPIPSTSDSGLGVSDCSCSSRFRNPQSEI